MGQQRDCLDACPGQRERAQQVQRRRAQRLTPAVGQQHLDPLANAETGVIILTAHMGNYDVAAPLFARRLKRRIHTVRVPDRHAETHEFMKERRVENISEWLTVHYNEPGSMLAVELTKLLQEGEFVAIQGDRVLFDVSA